MKTQYNKIIKINLWRIMFISLFISACRPEGDNLTLGNLPEPEFEATEISPGRIQLRNTTNTATIANWTIVSSGQKLQGDVVEAALTFAGNYDVKLDKEEWQV